MKSLALYLPLGILLNSCAALFGGAAGAYQGYKASSKEQSSSHSIATQRNIKEVVKAESSKLIGYQMNSSDGMFSFNVFAAEEPYWDQKTPLQLWIPLSSKGVKPMQCSFARRREPLGALLSRVNLGYPYLGIGEVRPGNFGPYPSLYVEKLYDKEGLGGAYAVKMIAVDLEQATLFCLHIGSGHKKSFFTVMDEIGKTIQMPAYNDGKKLLAVYLWSLRFDNYPRGFISERQYMRDDGLREIIREQVEIFEGQEGSQSVLDRVIQIKGPKQKGSLMFFQGQSNGQEVYQMALKREGINSYFVRGEAMGKPISFQIDANEKLPDLNERREVYANKLNQFSYSLFSPRVNPIALSKMSGRRFGDIKKECRYMIKRPEGIFEATCDSKGKITRFLPQKVSPHFLYSGRLIYESEIKRPFR